ncbi:O-methyltransferase [Sporomusa sp. KB1]|nr:O-methyltransferase [Sporomusa sp. KB1]
MLRRLLSTDVDVVAYCDNNVKLQGKAVDGLPVINPGQLFLKNPDRIYIAIINKEQSLKVKVQIEKLGIAAEIIPINAYREIFDLRLANLRWIAEEIYEQNTRGAVAELGVYQGDFATEINRLFPDRKIYLFDTFSGFDERDINIEKENMLSCAEAGRYNNTSVTRVLARLPYPGQAVFKAGYFPDTARGLEENFALVSLDADLYQPLFEGLKYFYPRVNIGGYIIIHDYNSSQYSGVKKAIRDFCRENRLFVVPICDLHGSAIIIKQ